MAIYDSLKEGDTEAVSVEDRVENDDEQEDDEGRAPLNVIPTKPNG